MFVDTVVCLVGLSLSGLHNETSLISVVLLPVLGTCVLFLFSANQYTYNSFSFNAHFNSNCYLPIVLRSSIISVHAWFKEVLSSTLAILSESSIRLVSFSCCLTDTNSAVKDSFSCWTCISLSRTSCKLCSSSSISLCAVSSSANTLGD